MYLLIKECRVDDEKITAAKKKKIWKSNEQCDFKQAALGIFIKKNCNDFEIWNSDDVSFPVFFTIDPSRRDNVQVQTYGILISTQ